MSNDIDNKEFVLKYKKQKNSEKRKKQKSPVKIFLVAVITIGYLALCIAIAIALNLDNSMVIVTGMLFVGAFVGAFIMQRILHIFSMHEKERTVLREVLEGSRGGRLITDAADNTVYFNGLMEDILGEPDVPTLEKMKEFFGDDEKTLSHFKYLEEQANKGLSASVEFHYKESNKEAWYVISAQPVPGWAGYIHWRVDDITEQREFDKSVNEEREKLIDFTDNAPVGFFSVDENGEFVFVNATFARWLGVDIRTLLNGCKLHTFFETPPNNAKPYDVKDGGGAKQIVETVMKGQGCKTFLASINQAVVHEEGGKVRTRGVVHDLTNEREMRNALKASEDKFQRFFDEAPLGIVLVDSSHEIKDCNNAFSHILGITIDELEGKNFENLIDEDNREDVLTALDNMMDGTRMPEPMEITLLGKKMVVTQMHARKIKDSNNIVLHFLDLTEQKNLEAQFAQSQKMQAVGQLAGGVAHDFNNLLTAIIGFCDLLLLRHKPGDSSFGDIMQIKQNSNRAANLVRQLLAFSRQQTLRPKIHDITDILTELSHLMRRLIGANIELEINHGSNLGLVKVDEGQMEQVLINLAVNARDAMNGGGILKIATSSFENKKDIEMVSGDIMPAGSWTVIEVEDSGCGIPEENITRIFEPFFTTKDVGQGTGLGLATVYGIIRQTGGFLHLESEVGKGTKFTIYLPVAVEDDDEEDEDKQVQENKITDLTGTARILLVEDEDAVRTFSQRALSNKGYDVITAEDGETAIKVLEEQEDKNIELLITDVIMPNMDGPTLAQRMRQENHELKIIFISGYTEEKLKEHMGENIWFLPKPFTLQQLAEKVKEVVAS